VSMNSRVCVTGLGVVSSIGQGKDAFWGHLVDGVSGITEVEAFDTKPFNVHRGGEIKDFEFEKFSTNKVKYPRCSQLAIAATKLAIEDSNLQISKSDKVSVVLGTTLGETQVIETIDSEWVLSEDLINKKLIMDYPTGNIAENVLDFFGLSGTSLVIPNACAAGNFAISYGYELIRSGQCDLVIAGGAEAMSKIAFTGFSRIFAIAPDMCRPFDLNRRGIMVGEGAGVIVLESESRARERSANIYCYVKGYGLSADAKSMVIPDEEGIFTAMKKALADAKVEPEEIDYICAHGTGTKANDISEAKAISRIFQKKNTNSMPLVTSIKSMLGHTMGAASAIEALTCALSIDTGFIPPTINLEKQDPECGISCVANTAVKRDIRIVINNAFAFGGNNSCVVFSKE